MSSGFVSSKRPQYLAATAACIGAFGLGTILGWSNPTISEIKKDSEFAEISESDESWIGSFVPLGALFSAPAAGYLVNRMGRKTTMLLTSAPFVLGWILIVYANNLAMMYAGRFITGFCGGAFSLGCPLFIGETAEASVRGTLGTGFQLMVTIGILFSYGIGAVMNWMWFSLVCGFVPLIFLVLMMFMPESPRYLLEKGKVAEATQALCWLRGAERGEQVEGELLDMQKSVDLSKQNKANVKEIFTTPALLRPTLISFALMFFQQLSGINAVIFYQAKIFEAANVSMDQNVASVLVGVVQVIATLVSSFVIDKVGRRILLIVSDVFMGLSLILLGIFFKIEESDRSSIGWLPLVSLMIFIIAFSLGYGPIPWMMIGEILPLEAKEMTATISTMLNWFLAFLVTKFFGDIQDAIGISWCYWAFAIVCGVGALYVFLVLPETKGKSLDEIQEHFRGNRPARRVRED